MKMIRKNILLTLAFVAVAVSAAAQSKTSNRVKVSQTQFYRQGDLVTVGMEIAVDEAKIASRAYVLLRPVLKNDSLDVSMELPAIMLNGKNRHNAYRRLVALRREPIHIGNVIDAGAKHAPKSYRYSATVPYEDWMKRSQVAVREDQCECNGPLVKMDFQLLAGTGSMEDRNPPVAPPRKTVDMTFTVSFIEPRPEAVKNRSEAGKAYLDFAAGRSEIRPEFKNNAGELDKINRMIAQVKNDPDATITKIIIDGYASPEGSYTSNMTLSDRRAIALKDYLRQIYLLPEKQFRVSGRGEDWATLEELLNASGAAYKDQALGVIRGTDAFDAREKKLMALQGGAPYKDMLANMFPALRRTDYELQYTVVPFTVDKGKQVLRTKPGNLSLNEMFLIANTYAPGSAEFNEVFRIASEVYPSSDIANANAAAAALSSGDHATATVYLGKITKPDAAALNNIGVTHAMRGEYETAAVYFVRARAEGNAEAVKNIAEIDKLNQVSK